MDPKIGPDSGPVIRILLKPDLEAQFWVPKTDPKLGPKIVQKIKQVVGKSTHKKSTQGGQKMPDERKPGRLEIIILWVQALACFPSSRFHIAAKANTF